MNKTDLIEIMIEELTQMKEAANADQAEEALTNILGYFEPLLRACAKEYDWRDIEDELVA
jgi:hypothetical protein